MLLSKFDEVQVGACELSRMRHWSGFAAMVKEMVLMMYLNVVDY